MFFGHLFFGLFEQKLLKLKEMVLNIFPSGAKIANESQLCFSSRNLPEDVFDENGPGTDSSEALKG